MATLYITEFGPQVILPLPVLPPVAEQTVAVGAGSAASSALNAATRYVRLSSDVTCSVSIGSAPTAATTNMRLAAGAVEYFAVPVNQAMKVAVIANS